MRMLMSKVGTNMECLPIGLQSMRVHAEIPGGESFQWTNLFPALFCSPGMFPKDALSVAQTQPREIAAQKKKNIVQKLSAWNLKNRKKNPGRRHYFLDVYHSWQSFGLSKNSGVFQFLFHFETYPKAYSNHYGSVKNGFISNSSHLSNS